MMPCPEKKQLQQCCQRLNVMLAIPAKQARHYHEQKGMHACKREKNE
jgi:hypothetical protein